MNYSDDKLLDKLDEIEKEKQDIADYNEYIIRRKKFLKIDENVNLLYPNELLIVSEHAFNVPHPPFKFPCINFLVFDDLVGDPHAFKRSNGRLNNLTIKCRHHHCSMLFTTQYPKAIPPVIRSNIDIWVLFRFASKERVLEQVYPEISSLITIEHFEELYTYATKTSAHDALVIDNHGKSNPDMRFRKNWNIVLKVS